jgi:hypothetical protein
VDLTDVPEPVARYLAHALGDDWDQAPESHIKMRGRIKVGLWLPFHASWVGDGRSLDWRAAVGIGPLAVLRVRDRFAAGAGSMDLRLFGRVPLVHADDEDTTRSAAGRAAAEGALWAPASLLPGRGVSWRAEADDHIVATCDVPPEQPEVHLRIDTRGAVSSVWLSRWTVTEGDGPGYVPFGVDVSDERAFGEMTIGVKISAGWWYGTPRYKPFFEAEVLSAVPVNSMAAQP